MQKMITARHFDLTAEIKERAEKEMDGLSKYFDNIISTEMILDTERHRRIAEVKVSVYNHVITGTGETDDVYTAMALAIDKAKVQLKKYKGKLRDKQPERIVEKIDSLTRPSTDVDEVDA